MVERRCRDIELQSCLFLSAVVIFENNISQRVAGAKTPNVMQKLVLLCLITDKVCGEIHYEANVAITQNCNVLFVKGCT